MSSTSSSGPGPKRLSGDEGASVVEYALLVALIALVCIGAVTVLGKNTNTSLSKAGASVAVAGT